jgi:hypothetical protein
VRERLEDAEQRRHWCLPPAERARHRQAEDAGARHRGRELGGQAPRTLGAVGGGARRGHEVAERLVERVVAHRERRRRAHGGVVHGSASRRKAGGLQAGGRAT